MSDIHLDETSGSIISSDSVSEKEHDLRITDLSFSQRWLLVELARAKADIRPFWEKRAALIQRCGYRDQLSEPFLAATEQLEDDLTGLVRLGLVSWTTVRDRSIGVYDLVSLLDEGVKLLAK